MEILFGVTVSSGGDIITDASIVGCGSVICSGRWRWSNLSNMIFGSWIYIVDGGVVIDSV